VVTDVLEVVIEGHHAGRITRTRGRLELRYDDTYRAEPDATPLSVTMPLTEARHQHDVVAPWLDGLLPDDDAVRRRWSRRFHVSAQPFALLGTPIGEECAGAAQFLPTQHLDAVLADEGDVAWLDDAGVAARLRELRADQTSWLGVDFTGRFSLAGVQAKTALLRDPVTGRWGVPSGAAATSHILKPAVAGLDDHELDEHLCLTTARACGLLVAPTSLARFEDQSAVVSVRFDRVADPGSRWLRRVHQEDLCQALGRPPEEKYQNDGGPGVRDICARLRDVLPPGHAESTVWRFFDACTFSWLIGGTDAHAKNYSLLLAGPQVRLAPLYDVASALPYPGMDVQRLRLAMKYGDDYTLRPRTPSMWPKVAKEFSLPADAVRTRARELAEQIPDRLADAVADPAVTDLGSSLPAALLDVVSDRVARCRRDTLT
jgi:serine/threonine-protein kinase HipA